MIVRYNLARCTDSSRAIALSPHPNIETTTVIAEIPDTVVSLIYQGWSITGVAVENDIANNFCSGNMKNL